jgi:hypothetical protein
MRMSDMIIVKAVHKSKGRLNRCSLRKNVVIEALLYIGV